MIALCHFWRGKPPKQGNQESKGLRPTYIDPTVSITSEPASFCLDFFVHLTLCQLGRWLAPVADWWDSGSSLRTGEGTSAGALL